ncbi:MAG: DUF368 domain-containing protein, partial [Bacilli bacterium]|nr:DUF368 domain-containing protein [Bacilli bacterium]
MLKNIIGGIAVGIANIIPGVSGGTFIVLLGLFDQLMESISNIFNLKIKLKNKKNDAIFIAQFLLGAAIGLIGFAKILEVLFVKFEVQTLYWFIGLILLSVPMLKRKEMNGEGINWLFLAIGLLLIAGLSYFSPGESGNIVPLEELVSKNMNFGFCLTLVGIGAIGGASMMFPGVSGSMVLLVLGYYHLFKGYVAHVTSFEPMILVALIFIAIGVGLGIITSAMITNYLLKHYKRNTMSFILG